MLRAEKPQPGYPRALDCLGDHIRKRRVDLELTQKQAAERLGVDPMTVNNWERHRTEPQVRHYPALFAFLGYNPLPEPTTFGERLAYDRVSRGLSHRELARLSGFDESSLLDWEHGRSQPTKLSRSRVAMYFGW